MRFRRIHFIQLAILSVLTLSPLCAVAQTVFRVHDAREHRIRVDGAVRDWRGVEMRAVGEGADASFVCGLAYNDSGIFFAASVRDDRVIRSARPGREDDALVLSWVHGRGGAQQVREVWLFPGVVNEREAAAAIGRPGRRPRLAQNVQVVEAPLTDRTGYRIEAFIPFEVLGAGDTWHQSRFAVRMRDVDQASRSRVEAEPASAVVDPRDLGALPELVVSGSDEETLRSFRAERDILHASPSFDMRGQVAGDGRRERVVVVDRYLAVMGAGHLGGTGYDYVELPVRHARDVRAARLQDLTGDGRAEVSIVLRQSNARGSRDLWMVYHLAPGALRPIFSAEVRKETSAGRVTTRHRTLRRRRGPPVLEVDRPRAEGITEDTYQEGSPTDAQSILTPWGRVALRQFRWDGSTIAMVHEELRAEEAPEAPAAPEAARAREAQSARVAPTAPVAPTAEALMREALRARGLEGQRSAFSMSVNVAADRRPELVRLVGGMLVVVGPGFRGGEGYFVWALPIGADAELRGLVTADLTGDGRAEFLFRIRQSLGAIEREVVLVHQFRPTGFHRVLAVETGRYMGERSVESEVIVPRPGRSGRLRIRPGRARGWDAASWNFAEGGQDGIRPVLLPWRDRTQSYELRGGELVPR